VSWDGGLGMRIGSGTLEGICQERGKTGTWGVQAAFTHGDSRSVVGSAGVIGSLAFGFPLSCGGWAVHDGDTRAAISGWL
jgi:hypothetical protein